jgi:hypothetical protein
VHHKDALTEFYRIHNQLHEDGPSSGSGERELNWCLDLVEVVLPYDGDMMSGEALQLKQEIIKDVWRHKEARRMLTTDETLAKRLAAVLLKNIIGWEEELMLVATSEGYKEPAWEVILRDAYGALITLYRDTTDVDSPLYKALIDRRFLCQLAKLLHSPEGRERNLVEGLLGSLVKWQISSPSQDSESVIRTVLGILQSGFADVNNEYNEITIRPVKNLLSIMNCLIEGSVGGEFERLVQTVFTNSVMTLFDLKCYQRYFDIFNALLKRQLTNARLRRNDVYLNTLTRQLVKYSFRRSLEDDQFNDDRRVELLMQLIVGGMLASEWYKPLITKVFSHVRKESCPEVQFALFKQMQHVSFREAFSKDSGVFQSEKVRITVLVELIKAVFDWYLASGTNAEVQKQISKIVESWMINGDNDLMRKDPEYARLADLVILKLWEQYYGPTHLESSLENLRLEEGCCDISSNVK